MWHASKPLRRPIHPPRPPQRRQTAQLHAPSSSSKRFRPDAVDPSVIAWQTGALVTGAFAGGYAGNNIHLRSYWVKRTLKCDEQPPSPTAVDQEQSSLLERLQKNLSLPSLPDLPSPPSLALPSLSLPDWSGTLSAWKSSLDKVSTAFSSLQAELSLGPESTYAHILQDAKNPAVHPEVQWDAQVRLGRDLPHTERAFLRNRRERMRAAFAKMVQVPLEEVDERDLPVVAVAASGGGYRAMLNTTASLLAAKGSGLFDLITYISAVSGSCWALNTLYSIGGGDLDWTMKHLRQRVKKPFLAPETFVNLFSIDDKASQLMLSAGILKRASQGGELSLPDVYGTLVSSRLYMTDSEGEDKVLPPPPRPLSLATMKTSTQRQYMDDGSHPLPIYTTVRHDLPTPEELAKAEKKEAAVAEAKSAAKANSGPHDKEGAIEAASTASGEGQGTTPVAAKLTWTWFETTPYEVGSDKLGAFIPTWSLGRVFENGKSTERVPELGVPILSGIYASAFCASLFSYFLEIKPLLAVLPYFSAIDDFVKSNAHKLDAIHPVPPAELPNFLYGLKSSLPASSSSSSSSPTTSTSQPALSHPHIPPALTEARTLGFADAGVELNLPYVPLLRRSVDVIIALDSSADSHDVWFTRAAEYAKTYEGGLGAAPDNDTGTEKRIRRSRWPAVDVKALFPSSEGGTIQIKENEKDRNQAAKRVDQAKQQETAAGLTGDTDEERGGVRSKNPKPTPLGSAPESKEMAAREAKEEGATSAKGEQTNKPMPESQSKEPPLSKCSIWLGSTKEEDAATCRNDNPTVEDVVKRDGIALAYVPLSPDEDFKNPLEVFSTWKFDYTEEETDRLIRLAKANFNAGEQQLKTVLKGVWLRKKQQRLQEEQK
ncbi:hypothetical protein JCM10908_002592 [Rhodotorula pacifica]|uniref:uncharacterized protein n=1 Tax=Rhodotorula pacifica TaxID=1495444 RepID=UPI0031748A86